MSKELIEKAKGDIKEDPIDFDEYDSKSIIGSAKEDNMIRVRDDRSEW